MKQRSRIMAFILAIVVTFCFSVGALAFDDYYGGDGVFADYGIMPLATISGYEVAAFAGTNISFTLSSGSSSTYTFATDNTYAFRSFGLRLTIPANSLSGTLSVFGLFPCTANKGSSVGWQTNSASSQSLRIAGYYLTSNPNPVYFYTDSSSNANSATSWNPISVLSSFNGTVHIPAHSGVIYLYIVGGAYTSLACGGVYTSGSSISFVPDKDYSSTLSQILSAVQSLASSIGSPGPVDQLVGGFQDKFGGQIEKVENALSPSNSALPNGGDIGGFVDDLSDGLGLSGSSFNSSDFSSATSGFTGSDSTAPGGPWEFFTQAVADDLSGDSNGLSLFDVEELDPILQWFEQAERRSSSWSNRS